MGYAGATVGLKPAPDKGYVAVGQAAWGVPGGS